MESSDDLLGKAKKLADKAEKLLEEGFDKAKEHFEKAKESETYAKINQSMNQAGEYVEKKLEEIRQGDLPDKIEAFRDKAEDKAETLIEQARAYGSIIADDVDEVIDSMKDKLSGQSKNSNQGSAS
jgi:ElaB/YqjD/DUF883 family membrane-anchored ribosome-binding protein